MRISDWSSDVCSSDLLRDRQERGHREARLGRTSADRAVERLHRLARLVVVREKAHDLARVGWLPPECLAKVVEDVATLFDPPADVLPATSQDDAADGSWMIGAVDDSVFGHLAACPDIGERRDIAVRS